MYGLTCGRPHTISARSGADGRSRSLILFFSPSLLEGVVFITASPHSFVITSHGDTFNIPYIPLSFGLAIAFYLEPHLFSSTACGEAFFVLVFYSPVVRYGHPVPRAYAHWLQHILVAIGLLRWVIAHH